MTSRAPAPSASGSPAQGDRREQILDAAACLFGSRDLALVTMDEVAGRAGVAKGTLYNYFSSKEDLYVSIIVGRMRHLLDALAAAFRDEESVRVRLRKFVIHTLLFLLKYPDFFRMMRKEECKPAEGTAGPVLTLREDLRTLLRGVLSRGMEEGNLRRMPLELAADLILGAVEGVALRMIEARAPVERNAEGPEILFDCLWASLAAADGAVSGGGALVGVRVLVTREELDGEGLSAEIAKLGGEPILIPFLRTAPPLDLGPLRDAVRRAGVYDWILFASARGVEGFSKAWREVGAPVLPNSTRFGAVGGATAGRLRALFGRVDLVAREMSGQGLACAVIDAGPVAGNRMLLPRVEEGRTDLADRLLEAGALVDTVIAYRTVPAAGDPRRIRAMLEAGEIQVVAFASPSAVHAFVDRIGNDLFVQTGRRFAMVTMGRTTSGALRSIGRAPDEEALRPSFAELARAAARAARRLAAGELS